MEPEMIADYACVTGENPLWHPGEKRLYWTDISTGRLFRYDPATSRHEQFLSGEVVGGFTFQADGALLLFMERGAVKIWRDGAMTTVIEEIPEECESRFNDVFADPEGRVFCGTMAYGDRPGSLYRLDTDAAIVKLLEGIGCSNGMGLTPDGKHLYYTDSAKREIYRFDYDRTTGSITNQRLWVRVPEADGEGVPDGLTVDAEGFVWSARWDGGCLVRYTPDGTEERRVHFPAKKVSSVIFGGRDYSDLYVTTAGGDHKETDGEHAGALFRINVGIKGTPEYPSRVIG